MSCPRSAVQPLEARLEPLAPAACFFVLSLNIPIYIYLYNTRARLPPTDIMGTRVHICSVERQLEPRLDEKLVILCARVEMIIRGASSLNEGTRCIVDGSYLAFATIQVDGYYHINEVVLQQITDECELAFGYNNAELVIADASRNQIAIECKFGKRATYPWRRVCMLMLVCGAVFVYCHGEPSLLDQIVSKCKDAIRQTNFTNFTGRPDI